MQPTGPNTSSLLTLCAEATGHKSCDVTEAAGHKSCDVTEVAS